MRLSPGRPFQQMVGGFAPPRLNSAASASSGRVRGVGGVARGGGRAQADPRSEAEEPSARSNCGSQAQNLTGGAFSPAALAWGEAPKRKSRSRKSRERSFQLRVWVTAGVRGSGGPSALRGVTTRGSPRPASESAPGPRGVPSQVPAARLACCVPGSRPCTHMWGKDVWPQPPFAASPPFATSSQTGALGKDPASLKQPGKVASLGLSFLLLLPVFTQPVKVLLLVQGFSPKPLLLPYPCPRYPMRASQAPSSTN